jgi:hypothetical protein
MGVTSQLARPGTLPTAAATQGVLEVPSGWLFQVTPPGSRSSQPPSPRQAKTGSEPAPVAAIRSISKRAAVTREPVGMALSGAKPTQA